MTARLLQAAGAMEDEGRKLRNREQVAAALKRESQVGLKSVSSRVAGTLAARKSPSRFAQLASCA